MDIESIVEKYSTSSDILRAAYRKWLIRFEKTLQEKKLDVRDALKDQAFLTQTFYFLKESTVSNSAYVRKARNIKNLGEYYGIVPKIPTRAAVMRAKEGESFFKSLNSIIYFIDKIGYKAMYNYNKKTDLLHLKAAVILGWYGNTLEKIVKIKKSDIKDGEKRFSVGDTKIPKKYYDIFVALADNDVQKSFPACKRLKLMGDEQYLFRTVKKGLSPLPSNIVPFFVSFNAVAESEGRVIVFKNLNKNALFVRVHGNRESYDDIHSYIKKVFGCDYAQASRLLEDYKRWVERFF